MNLDTRDKLILNFAIVGAIFWLFTGVATFPWWKTVLMTMASIGYISVGVKLWRVE